MRHDKSDRFKAFFTINKRIMPSNRLASVLLFFLAFLSNTSSLANPINWQQTGYITDSFLEIALKNNDARIEPIIRKWPASGIRYRFVHKLERQPHEALTEQHLQHLHSITNLPVELAATNQAANLTIVFNRESDLQNDLQHYFGIAPGSPIALALKDNVCFGSFSTQKNGAIDKAVIIIPVDRARENAKLVGCIVEQLSQVMGLTNDSEKVFPSIFNDKSVNTLLTGLDYVMLKILYDERLKSGMSFHKAAPLVEQIVADLTDQGVVRVADAEVRQGDLYQYEN